MIVHAGPGKTGTSTIQSALNEQSKNLHRQGVFYPNHLCDKNGISSGNLLSLMSQDSTGEFNIDLSKVQAITNLFERSQCHTLLLSSEFFFDHMVSINQVFSNVEFLIYLRDPIAVIESGYNQTVKRSGRTAKLSVKRKIPFRTLEVIDSILSRKIPLNLTIRPFENSLFYENDLLCDFFNTVGIDTSESHFNTINQSYSLEALEVKRELNQYLDPKQSHDLDILLQAYKGKINQFSFIEPEIYTFLRRRVHKVLIELIKKHKQNQLRPYMKKIRDKKQKPFVEQELSIEQARLVMEFIESENVDLHAQIIKSTDRSILIKEAIKS